MGRWEDRKIGSKDAEIAKDDLTAEDAEYAEKTEWGGLTLPSRPAPKGFRGLGSRLHVDGLRFEAAEVYYTRFEASEFIVGNSRLHLALLEKF